MPFSVHFCAPPNIIKYFEDTNPAMWLEDFCLTYRASGADDDLFIIQYFLLYLTESA
jgi:hypothetical protein